MIALFVACAMFWAGFEQTGASLNLFAERHTDRVIFGWEMPTGWLQGVNRPSSSSSRRCSRRSG
jgi:POT family proton-dependent oligopeptide transporter